VRLTSFDPPQPDRLTEAKGSGFSSVADVRQPALDGDAGDLRLKARGAE